MPESRGSVLIVDDQYLVVEFLRAIVEGYEFDVCGTAATADAAVKLALLHKPDRILMDVRLEGERDGIEAAMEIAKSFNTRIIYITGSSESSTIERINQDHPFAVLIKPINPVELGRVLMAP